MNTLYIVLRPSNDDCESTLVAAFHFQEKAVDFCAKLNNLCDDFSDEFDLDMDDADYDKQYDEYIELLSPELKEMISKFNIEIGCGYYFNVVEVDCGD
jgi:hypothetical protein